MWQAFYHFLQGFELILLIDIYIFSLPKINKQDVTL